MPALIRLIRCLTGFLPNDDELTDDEEYLFKPSLEKRKGKKG